VTRARLAPLAALLLAAPSASADDLSGADRLRVLWSNQMMWTPAGVPVITVGIADGMSEVVIEGAGARLLPDGDGGSEVRGGGRWTVRADAARKGVIRWYVVVAAEHPSEVGTARLREQAKLWRERGLPPRNLELGGVLGLRGEVIDMRRVLLGVSPRDTLEEARRDAAAIAERHHVEPSLQAVLVERPRGVIEARDERGTVVRSEGVLWFAPGRDDGVLAVARVPHAEATAGPSPSAAAAAPGAGAPPSPAAAPGERREYTGRLYVTIGSDGKLVAANAVPEDQLLTGLLPAEIGAGAPPEALKAQAVAARNELYARMGSRHLTDPYRICARSHCQVYAGAGHADARAARAVEATRGELLVRADGTLVDAVYSADCGGHTEDNDRAWATTADPALRGVLDAEPDSARALSAFAVVADAAAFLGPLPARPSCAADRSFRWTARVEGAALGERAGVGRVRDVVVLERGTSGRVVRLRVDGERGKKEVRGELEVRRLLGGLKSALIAIRTVEREGDGGVRALEVTGGGHGHGVGLCQAGAITMAERHHDYRQILERYYRSATIKKLY